MANGVSGVLVPAGMECIRVNFLPEHRGARALNHPGAVVVVEGDTAGITKIEITAKIVLFVTSFAGVGKNLHIHADHSFFSGDFSNIKIRGDRTCFNKFYPRILPELLASLGVFLIQEANPPRKQT